MLFSLNMYALYQEINIQYICGKPVSNKNETKHT